jgi:hypothetical protein
MSSSGETVWSARHLPTGEAEMVAVRGGDAAHDNPGSGNPAIQDRCPRTGGFASPPYDGFAKFQKSVRRIMVLMCASAMFDLARLPET